MCKNSIGAKPRGERARTKGEVKERATFTPPLIRPARSYRPSLLWFRQWNSRQVHGERVNSLAALPRRSRKETNRIGDGVKEGIRKFIFLTGTGNRQSKGD